LFIKSYLKNI